MSRLADPRVARLIALLEAEGFSGVHARVAGHEDEIVVLSAPTDAWARLVDPNAGPLLARVKQLGFRYVTLDLESGAS